MAKQPEDRYDDVADDTERVGAHRGPRKRFRGLVRTLWALLATVVLTGAGWVVLQEFVNDGGSGLDDLAEVVDTRPEYEIPVAEAVADSKITVTVLNGTEEVGLASAVAGQLEDADWNVVADANANTTDFETTTIFYNHLDSEGAARGLAEELGGVKVQLATAYQGSRLTVVIGADYLEDAS